LRYRKGIGEELFWEAVVNTLRQPLSVPPMAIWLYVDFNRYMSMILKLKNRKHHTTSTSHWHHSLLANELLIITTTFQDLFIYLSIFSVIGIPGSNSLWWMQSFIPFSSSRLTNTLWTQSLSSVMLTFGITFIFYDCVDLEKKDICALTTARILSSMLL
jgi:hypothetical protein